MNRSSTYSRAGCQRGCGVGNRRANKEVGIRRRQHEDLMKAFFWAFMAMIGISYVASVVLENYQGTADSAFVGKGARPDPEPKLRGGPEKPRS